MRLPKHPPKLTDQYQVHGGGAMDLHIPPITEKPCHTALDSSEELPDFHLTESHANFSTINKA